MVNKRKTTKNVLWIQDSLSFYQSSTDYVKNTTIRSYWGYEVIITGVRSVAHNSNIFTGRVVMNCIQNKPESTAPVLDKANNMARYFFSGKEMLKAAEGKKFATHPHYQKAMLGEKTAAAVRALMSNHSISKTKILVENQIKDLNEILSPLACWNVYSSHGKKQEYRADVTLINTDVDLGQESTQESLELGYYENPTEGKNYPKQTAKIAEKSQKNAQWSLEKGNSQITIERTEEGHNQIVMTEKSAVSITPDGVQRAEQGNVEIPEGYANATYLSPNNTFTQTLLENLGNES